MAAQSPFHPVDFAFAEPFFSENGVRNLSSIDPKLSRTNYYDGRLLKASDLIRDQLYLDERLREVGRVLGQGIVKGLEINLTDTGVLQVAPGIAVTPSGRVLELERQVLQINLYDAAGIAELNAGFRYLERGLYAVVLQYAEKGEGSAEIYPRDLEGERGFHFNAFAEGVEIALTPLRARFPARAKQEAERIDASVFARAALARELLGNRGQPLEISEHGVALGLMAVENGRPRWLDRGLVRRPHREPQSRNALQWDLFHHYEELLRDVLRLRQQSTRRNPFPVAHYFELLPPFGSVPKECVDPENGYQRFFPRGFEVSIAPLRSDDLDAVIQQSAALEPIDLKRDRDVDIMLLVPLPDHVFAWRARQLQHVSAAGSDHTQLLHLDSYALRLYGESPVHRENTDAAVWADIWAATENVYFVRRPTRVAETQVSAVVLASGYSLPATVEALPPDVAGMEERIVALEEDVSRLESENETLRFELEKDPDEVLAEAQEQIKELQAQIQSAQAEIGRLGEENQLLSEELEALHQQLEDAGNKIKDLEQRLQSAQAETPAQPVETLLQWRPVEDSDAQKAAQNLAGKIGGDQKLLSLVNQLLIVMGREYDSLNWPTLEAVNESGGLEKLLQLLTDAAGKPLPQVMVDNLANFDVKEGLIGAWKKLI